MNVAKVHLTLGILWLLGGMALGEHMGRTGDHGQMPTHAHIMLVGGVLPILWAIINRVWNIGSGLFTWLQLALHHGATALMVYGLYMLYAGGNAAELGPLLGVSAGLVMLATLIMLVLSIRGKAEA